MKHSLFQIESKRHVFGVVFKQAFFSRDPVAMRRILELEKKLLGSAKFYEMGCNQSPESARVAYEGMN